MKKVKYLHLTILTALLLILSFSCSTAPKNPGDIYELRTLTEKELAVANREAARGSFEIARGILEECIKKATLADDESLIIRCNLALGNVLLSLSRDDEAFSQWEQALNMAAKNGGELLSVSRIYNARGKLLAGRAEAQTVLEEVNREAVNVKSDKLFIAFSWQVRALALRELKSFKEAEDAVKRSLDIHQKENYLENASYDWYMIGSIRSLAGNTKGALEALEASLVLDRRVENTWGIAANWRAIGDVHRKAGNVNEAMQAWKRAKDIFEAMGNAYETAEMEKRMKS